MRVQACRGVLGRIIGVEVRSGPQGSLRVLPGESNPNHRRPVLSDIVKAPAQAGSVRQRAPDYVRRAQCFCKEEKVKVPHEEYATVYSSGFEGELKITKLTIIPGNPVRIKLRGELLTDERPKAESK
jgi:hypothetical protein